MTETARHIRLAILRFLEEAPGYTSNISLLTAQLPTVGFHLSRDQVRAQCAWLKEQGLARTEDTMGLTLVTATARGVDVAQGVASDPGVARPGPKD